MPIPMDKIPTCEAAKRNDPRYHVCDSVKELRRERKRRNRSPKTREELEYALSAHDRIAAVSAEIRAKAGLEPLEDNVLIRGYRSRLAEIGPAKRKAKSSPADPIADIARRRKQLEQE